MDGTDSKAQSDQQKSTNEGGMKELIESILVAFILAFVFRAFIVEAFVIPTGSMAPTLLGAHMRYSCRDCGYSWTVNFSGQQINGDVVVPSAAMVNLPERYSYTYKDGTRVVGPAVVPRVYSIHCPNCGFKLPREDSTGSPIFYGDRILVQKYLYLFQEPKRWDVVVFKNPEEASIRNPTNYIKRLVGRPNEQLLVLDGDLYVSDKKNAVPRPEDFVIQTKTRPAQDALWRIVYDNDFHPSGVTRPDGTKWAQPWVPTERDDKHWSTQTTAGGRVFLCDVPDALSELKFDPQVNPNVHPLTDWLAYDQIPLDEREMEIDDYQRRPYIPGANVSDLKLSLYYQRQSGSGALRLHLTKRDDTFIAEIYPDKVRVIRKNAKGETRIGQEVAMQIGSNTRIDFQNVDYQVTLSIGGDPVIQSTPAEYAPDVAGLIEESQKFDSRSAPQSNVWISAEKQACAISHVSLWRDVFYLSGGLNWHAAPNHFPDHVMKLGNDEYFCMGDNSMVSRDGRYWTRAVDLPDEDLITDAGKVPGRFLMGKAFFVYWPAGYKLMNSLPAVIPNFGSMRFIH